MADRTIFDLTQETALNAGDRLAVQQTSAATPTTSATFALLGGLEIETTFDTAADHADISAAAGNLYIVNTSALASDMNFTLPIAANVQTGERVGVFLSTGDATQEMDLKSGAVGDLINGVDHSTNSWSRLFITGECVIFQCIDGATGDWAVVYDGRIPCAGRMYLGSNAVNHMVAANTLYQVPFDTSDYDRGDIVNTAGDDFVIRRASRYHLAGTWTPAEAVIDSEQYTVRIAINNGATSIGFAAIGLSGTSAGSRLYISNITDVLTVGDTVELWCRLTGSTNMDITGTTSATHFDLVEIL